MNPDNMQQFDAGMVISEDAHEVLLTMQKHLEAVSQKNIGSLVETLSPANKMQLILPGQEIVFGADKFLAFHAEWFQDTTWSFETQILDLEVGDPIATATTQIIYREPERDGKPYFNRMIVTYILEKVDGHWYVISDHASSVEKSTD